MKKNKKRAEGPLRVLVSGGGTGGHIFPAISIADAVRRRHPDAEIMFVGANGRMEMERVPAAGYPITGLDVEGFDRKRLWRNIPIVFKLLRSLFKARRLVKNFNPDIAVGVGGYASGPTLKAAQRAGVPTLLQEQNSYAGVTNKLLAQKARAICTAYPDMERFFPADKIIMTGNPVRRQLNEGALPQPEAKKKLGFDPGKPLLLVVGGSLGAGTLNSFMAANAASLAPHMQILWQTGKNGIAVAEEALRGKKMPGVKATAFISDMPAAYAASDLVVARAGAGTISELELLGKAAILVPSPNVAEDHQRHNAEALACRGAARMVLDADVHTQLADLVKDLMADKDARACLSENIRQMALEDAAEKIADQIDKIVKDEQAH